MAGTSAPSNQDGWLERNALRLGLESRTFDCHQIIESLMPALTLPTRTYLLSGSLDGITVITAEGWSCCLHSPRLVNAVAVGSTRNRAARRDRPTDDRF